MQDRSKFLPISMSDLKERGIEQLDFVFITGDAYVDHPSFGAAVLGRVLESEGYTVGIIAQPDYKDVEAFKVLGKPRLGFLVNSGNIDSMVNHYTAAKKPRRDDFYSPGGKAGYRPDRALLVYCAKIKEAYKDVPVIIGGIEASLRRYAHYDYWSDKVRRSILLDSKADLLVYGMAEKQILEIAKYLNYGSNVKNIKGIRGTCYLTNDISKLKNYIEVPSFEDVSTDKSAYNEAFKLEYNEMDEIRGKAVVQKYGTRYLVQNPPAHALSQKEMDAIYDLPYVRDYHPIYEPMGGIPAIKVVKHSIISQRGCFGSCSFCALTFHQGRAIQSRSHESILDEAKTITKLSDFKGYIDDVGGPTANFRNRSCDKQVKHGTCKGKECLFPKPCKQLKVDHTDYLNLLREIRSLEGVKKVFVSSGIRYDYLTYDNNTEFFEELAKHHISGQLKVAPEHISPKVLKHMGKPGRDVYDRFVKQFNTINKKLGMNQFVVPYLMSSHPGSDLDAAIELAQYIKEWGYMPEQVQDFYPTPGSLSTTVYYTGINPFTNEEVYVPRTHKEKAMQRALLQFDNPKNHELVKEALILAKREDLIGYEPNCLIPPVPRRSSGKSKGKPSKGNYGKGNPTFKSGNKKYGNQRSNSGKPSEHKEHSRNGKSSDHNNDSKKGKSSERNDYSKSSKPSERTQRSKNGKPSNRNQQSSKKRNNKR